MPDLPKYCCLNLGTPSCFYMKPTSLSQMINYQGKMVHAIVMSNKIIHFAIELVKGLGGACVSQHHVSEKLTTKDKKIHQCSNKHLVLRVKEPHSFFCIGQGLKLQFCPFSGVSKNTKIGSIGLLGRKEISETVVT